VISEDFDRVGELHETPQQRFGTFLDSAICKLDAPAAVSTRQCPIVKPVWLRTAFTNGKAVKGRFTAAHAHGDVLRGRLAGNGIGNGRDESVDAPFRGELVGPVHGHEDGTGTLPRREERTDDHRAMAAFDVQEIGGAYAEAGGIVRVNFSK